MVGTGALSYVKKRVRMFGSHMANLSRSWFLLTVVCLFSRLRASILTPPHAIFLIWALDWSVFLRQIILDLSNHIISSSCVLLLKLSLNDLWILLIFLLPQMLSHRSLEEMFYMLIFLIAPPPLPSEILEHLAVFLCWDRRFKNACYCGLLISFKKGRTEGVCAL